MADSTIAAAPKSSRLVKWLGIAFVGIIVLILVGYFVGTSSGFLKSMILPRASAALGAQVDAEAIELSPFSELVIRGLKVSTAGSTDPLLAAKTVRAAYSLTAIIGGKISVSEVLLDSPRVSLQFNADGTSNLTPIQKALAGGSAPPAKSSGSKPPPTLDIGSVRLEKAELVYLKHLTNGLQDRVSVSGLDLAVGPIRNGQPIQIELGANLAAQLAPAKVGAKPDSLEASLKTKLAVLLDAQFQPASATASSFILEVNQASGGMSDLKGLSANIGLDWSPAEIKQLALRFAKAGQPLGEILAQGPFKSLQQEGRLTVIVRGIGPEVLQLATASSGIDLGRLVLGTTNTIELSNAGKNISIDGSLAGNQMAVSHPAFRSPTVDFSLQYQATIDQPNRQAQLRVFKAAVVQGANPLVKVTLAQPTTVDWGTGGGTPAESALDVEVASLQLADWIPAGMTNAPTGKLDLTLALKSKQSGKDLAYNANLRISDLAGIAPNLKVPPAQVGLTVAGRVDQFKSLELSSLSLSVSDSVGQLMQASGQARFDTASQAADANMEIKASLNRLGAWLPVPDLQIQSGQTTLKIKASQKQLTAAVGTNAPTFQRSLQLQSSVESLYAKFQQIVLSGWSKDATVDAQLDGDVLTIKQLRAQVKPSAMTAPSGLELSGTYDIKKSSGSMNAGFSKITQELLRPILTGSAFGSNLVSAEINGRLQADFKGTAGANFTGLVGLTNLVVKTASAPRGTVPMATSVALDAGSTGAVHSIRSMKLALGPTARAPKNELELRGQVQLLQTNKIQGKLEILSEAIDVTTWYEIFGGSSSDTNKTSSTTASTKPGGPATEPKGMQTPLQPFAFNLAIGRFFLGDIGLSNLVCQGEIQGGKISVKPAGFVMNRVTNEFTAALDLGVDGYTYDVMLKAPGIPLEPFANTFTPNFRGQLQGDLFVNGSIKGAGTTGANLRRSLLGGLQASVTNANMQIVGPKTRAILTPIAFALRLNDLLKSPLHGFDVQTEFGQGQIRLKQLAVLSDLFRAEGVGTIPIADDINQSPINIPVNFSLTRATAQRANLLPANTPTNQVFVQLPQFATVKGTIGAPTTDIDKLVIGGILLRSTAGIPGLAGEKAGNLIQGIGNLLTGQGAKPAENQAPAAAQPAAPAPGNAAPKPVPSAVPAQPAPPAPPAPASAPPQGNNTPARRPSLLQQLPGIILTNRNSLLAPATNSSSGASTNKPVAPQPNSPAAAPAKKN